MEKPFVYGMAVEGENFTDREKETQRLKKNFENGMNVILISPRRMGKTSLVKRVRSLVDRQKVCVVMMDIYDCRSEYEFYNRFAATIIKETAGRMEQAMESVRRFLVRLTPKVSFSPDQVSEYSISLGITPQNYTPEEVLSLPEKIAHDKGIHIVVCIDEFQQIGEMPSSLELQKRMRGVWQHQRSVSYCLFGSNKHLMSNLFQNRRMPFYQFGDLNELSPISTDDWVPFLQRRFASSGKTIGEEYARRICELVANQSSYVQQLAWNVMVETEQAVDEESLLGGWNTMLAQSESFFLEQIRGLSAYQMNFIRLLCNGVHTGFGKAQTAYPIGTRSNISRIKATLIEKEIIEERSDRGVYLLDAVFEHWFRRGYMEAYG